MEVIKSLLLLASAMAIGMGPALALQATVTKIDKNSDGTMTY